MIFQKKKGQMIEQKIWLRMIKWINSSKININLCQIMNKVSLFHFFKIGLAGSIDTPQFRVELGS